MTRLVYFFLMFILVSSCRTEPATTTDASKTTSPTSLQLRLNAEPDGLSPILARTGASRQVYRHLYVQLLDVDPVSMNIVPELAEKNATITELEDGKQRLSFDIHATARWSDGTPLTVQDVLFSYKILLHPTVKTRYKVIADMINDMELDQDNPQRINFLTEECFIALESSIGEMYIYPEHIYDPEKRMRKIPFSDFKTEEKIATLVKNNAELEAVGKRIMDPEYVRDPAKFVTAGAYIFEEWKTGQNITLRKNTAWWGDQFKSNVFTSRTEKIQFQIIPDNTTAITQLTNGEIDALSNVTAELFDENKTKENLVAKTSSILQMVWLSLNTKSGLLQDKNVRQALAYVCDEESIIKNARNGYAKLITGPFMPGTNEYNKDVPATGYQPDKAKKLLLESGWEDSDRDGILDKMIDGKKTKLSLEFVVSSKSTTGPIVGELLKNTAKKVGFEIRITPKDSKVYRQNQIAGDFDIVLQGASFYPGLYDPKGRWHTASFPPNGQNYPRFGNSKTDAMIDELRSTCKDEVRRTNLYHKLHAIISEEQPVIFLYNAEMLHLINKKFDNIVVSPNRPGLFEEFLTLK